MTGNPPATAMCVSRQPGIEARDAAPEQIRELPHTDV